MNNMSNQDVHTSRNAVAIIGVGGMFPGSTNLEKLFEQLKDGTDWVRPVSADRLRDACCDPQKMYKPVGYLDEVDKFDHSFFNLSKSEAEAIDPVQRKLLELAYTAFEDAGMGPREFRGQKINVYIGGLGSNYQALSAMESAVSIIGNTNGIIAGRIAYALDLRGSAIMLDTTCSSALTAIHEAYRHILAGDTQIALAGSFNVQLFYAQRDEYSPLNTMSSDGKCKPFDASANGIGSGEGGGIIVLKKYESAIADGDHIYAVIKGGAANSDGGLSNGLTAPSPEAQKRLILDAWEDAGVDPRTIGYIEAHGTGTKLGDPIEFQALTEAFRAHNVPNKSCAIGAVKSNFGHLDHAAGMAGIFKILCGFKYGKLFPTVHFQQPNPYLDYENSPLYVNTVYRDWNVSTGPYRAGISSFGLSGTNIHLVLEEHRTSDQNSIGTAEDLLLRVSAKTKDSLITYCQNISKTLSACPAGKVKDLLFTLNSSRGEYDFQYISQAADLSHLIKSLVIGIKDISPNKASEGLTVFLCDEQLPSAFIDTINKVDINISEYRERILALSDEPWARVIADQFSFLLFLDFLDIKYNRIIAGGLGRITHRVSQDRSLISRISQLINEEIHLLPLNVVKVEQVLSAIEEKESNAVFLAINNNCSLAQLAGRLRPDLRTGTLSSSDGQSSLNPFFEFCFRHRISFNLKKYGLKQGFRLMPAPTYPFQNIRCWFELKDNETRKPKPALTGKLHTMEWIIDKPAPGFQPFEKQILISFTEARSLFQRAMPDQEKSNQLILVNFGESFIKKSKYHYEINRNAETDFLQLFSSVRDDFFGLTGIVIEVDNEADQDLGHASESGLLTDLFITKALNLSLQRRGFSVFIISQGLYDTDFKLSTAGAARWGFWKGILSDYPSLNIRLIDFAINDSDDVKVSALIGEISNDFQLKVTRYEDGKRLVPWIKPIEFSGWEAPVITQRKGTYLITGGFGRIGRHICTALAMHAERLIIMSRTSLNDEPERRKLVEQWQAAGALVECYQVDISNEAQMANIFDNLYQKQTTLSAVYHLAGIADDIVPADAKSVKAFKRTIAPKISGTKLLKKFTEGMKPEYFIMFSSLNAILPKKNSFDYAAANAAEDHMAFKIPMQGNTKFISINWPGWDVFESESGIGAIKPAEGIEITNLILKLGKSNVLVSAASDLAVYRVNPFFCLKEEATEDLAQVEAAAPNPPSDAGCSETLEVEEIIKKIWEDVLKSDDVQLTDDFFDIGGHSLNGTQVLNRIFKQLNVEVDMDEFFDYGTLQGLSDIVKERLGVVQEKVTADFDKITVRPLPMQADYETSAIQRSFWLNSTIQEGSRIYNLVFPFFIKVRLDKELLQKTMQYLLLRHESLRTSFRLSDGEIRQCINQPADVAKFSIEYKAGADEAKWDAYAQMEHDRMFNLDDGFLIRASVITFRDNYHLFVLTLHHLVADGWSHGVLLKDFIAAYKAFSTGQLPGLTPLKFHYKDYVVWLKNLQEAKSAEDADYWDDKLQGDWPMLTKNQDPGTDIRKWQAGTIKMTCTRENTLALKAYAKKQDTTLFMLLTATVKVLLHQLFGWEDIVVGTVTSGRLNAEFENQIGNYLNTLALRDRVTMDMSFDDLLKAVRKTVLEAFKHQSFPFSKIVERKLNEGAAWREDWIDVQINLHNYLRVEDYLRDESDLFEVPQETTDYDHDTDWNLHFNCLELENDVLSIYINYSKQMLSEEIIRELVAKLTMLLDEIVTGAKISISEIATEKNIAN